MTTTAPVIAEADRRRLAVVSAVSAGVVLVLAVRYHGVEGPGRGDAVIGHAVAAGLEPIRGMLRSLVVVLGPPTVVGLAVLLAVLCLRMRRSRLAVVAISGPFLTGVTTTVLQPVVGRTLDGAAALPSGHTAGATAVTIVAALLWVDTTQRSLLVSALAVASVVVVGGGMAVALVANGLHVPTDTMAGFCTAVAVVVGSALGIDTIANRRTRTDPFEPVC